MNQLFGVNVSRPACHNPLHQILCPRGRKGYHQLSQTGLVLSSRQNQIVHTLISVNCPHFEQIRYPHLRMVEILETLRGCFLIYIDIFFKVLAQRLGGHGNELQTRAVAVINWTRFLT